jgi:RNA polymerase sigma-70 factor (ECF subfamily)
VATNASGVNQETHIENLLIGYQRGDHGAAAALVVAVSPMLLRYCIGNGDERREAEDVVQEIWLRIHKARHTYRAGEPALPWLYAIARHTRLDAYRRKRRLLLHEIAFTTMPDTAAPVHSDQQQLAEMLDLLPPSEREVVTMLKGLGMTVEEVAGATASTAGSVKQKAHRAYKRLREFVASPVEGRS